MNILAIFLALSFSPLGEWTLAGHYPKGLESMEDFEIVAYGVCKPNPTQVFKCNKVRDNARNEDFFVVFDAQGEIIVVYKLDGKKITLVYPLEELPKGIQGGI